MTNVGRKINLNLYDQDNLYSVAEAIRRHGMDYRKKLQQNYCSNNKSLLSSHVSKEKCSLNQQREMKNWYE